MHQTASFELLWATIGLRVWAVALLKNKKKSLDLYYVVPTWRLETRPLVGS